MFTLFTFATETFTSCVNIITLLHAPIVTIHTHTHTQLHKCSQIHQRSLPPLGNICVPPQQQGCGGQWQRRPTPGAGGKPRHWWPSAALGRRARGRHLSRLRSEGPMHSSGGSSLGFEASGVDVYMAAANWEQQGPLLPPNVNCP